MPPFTLAQYVAGFAERLENERKTKIPFFIEHIESIWQACVDQALSTRMRL
jgi:hypothetical protein